MDKSRKVVSVLIGVIVGLLVFLAWFFIITSNLQKNKNLRLQENLQTALDEKEMMADEIALGEQEKEALREEVASARNKLSACLSSKDGLAANAKNLDRLVRMSDKQTRQLIQEKNFLQTNSVELTAKLEETLKANRALQKILGVLKAEISALKKELKQKQALISEKTIEADMAGSEADSLRSDLAAREEQAKNDRADFLRQKAELRKKLKKKEAQLKRVADMLADSKKNIDLLVSDNARQRLGLKEKTAQWAELRTKIKQLSAAVADFSPTLIAEIHFATGEWRLTHEHKAILDLAKEKMRGYGPDFIGLVKGSSDPQPFPDNSDHKNLKLSARRALAVESYLLAKPGKIPPIAIMGLSDIFAPAEPVNNQAERTAVIFMVKKNPPDLDGLLSGLQNCLKGAN